jgi:adhesin transport system outer membrane protein
VLRAPEHFRFSSNRENALSVGFDAISNAKPLRTFAGVALGVFMTATMLAGCSPTAGPRIIKHVPAVAKSEVQEVQGEVKVGLPTIETPPAEKTPVKAEGDAKTVAIDGMNLQNAIGVALARHPDIGRANAVVAQSNAQVSIEKAAWFPTVSYGVQPGYSSYGGSTNNNGGSALKGTVGANQLIYDFGATSGRIRAAEATSEKQRHLLDNTMEQVGSTMAGIFIELSSAQDIIRAAKGEVEAVQEIRDKIAQRVEAGISDVVDLNQADVAVQRANADLLGAQNRFDIAAGRFAEMTGIRPQRVASLVETAALLDRLKRGAPDVDNTPSVMAAAAEVRAAEQRLKVAKSSRFPSVSVSVSQSATTGDRNSSNDSTFVGLQLGGDFSLGRREKHEIEASEAELRAAKQTRDNDVMTTRTTLGSAETEGAGAEERMSNARRMMTLSLSSRDLYWQQYTLDKRSLTDVVNAERDTFMAESEYITAQADRLSARVKAYVAVGQLVKRIREGAK